MKKSIRKPAPAAAPVKLLVVRAGLKAGKLR
jgi:hypothetical protein